MHSSQPQSLSPSSSSPCQGFATQYERHKANDTISIVLVLRIALSQQTIFSVLRALACPFTAVLVALARLQITEETESSISSWYNFPFKQRRREGLVDRVRAITITTATKPSSIVEAEDVDTACSPCL